MFAYISINSFLENYFSSFMFGLFLFLFVSCLFVLVGSFVCDFRFRYLFFVCLIFVTNFSFTNYSVFVYKDVNHFSVENPTLYIIIPKPHVNHFSVENAASPRKGVNHFSVDNPTFHFGLVGPKSNILATLDFKFQYGNVNHFRHPRLSDPVAFENSPGIFFPFQNFSGDFSTHQNVSGDTKI